MIIMNASKRNVGKGEIARKEPSGPKRGVFSRFFGNQDSVSSPDAIKSMKQAAKLFANLSHEPERYLEMVRAVARKAEYIEADPRSLLKVADMACSVDNGAFDDFSIIISAGYENLDDFQKSKFEKKLGAMIKKETRGLEKNAISLSNSYNEIRIRNIAQLFQVCAENWEEAKLDNSVVDAFLSAATARFSGNDDGISSFSERTRLECAKAVWELGESRGDSFWELLNSDSSKVAGFVASRISGIEKDGGWDLLDDFIKENSGRISASTSISHMLAGEDGRRYISSRLGNKTSVPLLIDAMAKGAEHLSEEMISQADAFLDRKDVQERVLDILDSRSYLMEGSKLYGLAESETNRRAVRMLGRFDNRAFEQLITKGNGMAAEEAIGEKPSRTREVLGKLYDSQNTVNVKTGNGYEDVPLWVSVASKSLVDTKTTEMEKRAALEFLLEKKTNRSISAAIRGAGLDNIVPALGRIRARMEKTEADPKEVSKFTINSILKWSLRNGRSPDIRAKAIDFLSKQKDVRKNIRDIALMEFGKADASKATLGAAIKLASRHGFAENTEDYLLEIAKENKEGLGVSAISVLVSNEKEVPQELVKSRLMELEVSRKNPQSINDAISLMNIIPVVAPEIGADDEAVAKVLELNKVTGAAAFYPIGSFASKGSKEAVNVADSLLAQANAFLDSVEQGGANADELYALFNAVAQLSRGGYSPARETLMDEFIPVLYTKIGKGGQIGQLSELMMLNMTPMIMGMRDDADESRSKISNSLVAFLRRKHNEMARPRDLKIKAKNAQEAEMILSEITARVSFSKSMLDEFPELKGDPANESADSDAGAGSGTDVPDS